MTAARIADLKRRLTAVQVVALTLFGEARGEPPAGKVAVACVIRNRVRTRYRGTTYQEVCLARQQFSCWNASDPNSKRLDGLANELLAGTTAAEIEARHAGWAMCWLTATRVVEDVVEDPTHGARHYHERHVHPDWAAGRTPDYAAGAHLFYAGVA